MDIWRYLEVLIRLGVAIILGGIIGYERENTRRPAGFRTHILVCAGSALVMVTSEYLFSLHGGDPGRLGAQVISGMGFLGAGTIIRDGFNVRGLTTAASLWAVACVGIAAGIGFYEGAIIAAALIFLTLRGFKSIERLVSAKFRTIFVIAGDRTGLLAEISKIFEENDISVRKIDFIDGEEEPDTVSIKFDVKIPTSCKIKKIVEKIYTIDSVVKVTEE